MTFGASTTKTRRCLVCEETFINRGRGPMPLICYDCSSRQKGRTAAARALRAANRDANLLVMPVERDDAWQPRKRRKQTTMDELRKRCDRLAPEPVRWDGPRS